jgi:archaellum component FlaC
MTNEEFQQIVLEKLGQLETELNSVTAKLGEVHNDLNGVKIELSEVKDDVAGIKTELSEVKTQLNAVCEQTANLTEFKTDTEQHFADIKETLGFVLHKEIENERELYVLKMKQVK